MIPKKIHYCWFGKKPLPENVLKYMESWRKYLPDCEIKEWNEENFDVNQYRYTKEAYYAKKYAFVSDVARLHALVSEGGLYLDTDVLILKSFEPKMWEKQAFIGFEHESFIGTGLIAAEAEHPFFKFFLDEYRKIHFFKGLKYDYETNVSRITKLFLKKGLVPNNMNQTVANVNVYKQDFFCNKDWISNQYYNTDVSYAIHDFQSSWCSKSKRKWTRVVERLSDIKTILSYKACCE